MRMMKRGGKTRHFKGGRKAWGGERGEPTEKHRTGKRSRGRR